MRMDGAESAFVDPAKIRRYLLNVEHRVGGPKARFFAHLGFTPQDWTLLSAQIAATAHGDAVLAGSTPFGRKFTVRATVTGPGGRSAVVQVVWIILKTEAFPRFVTAYPGDPR